MTTLELADRIAAGTGRRGFLARAGAATLGAAAAVLATEQPAQAVEFWHCCCFCASPRSCSYSCAWCWLGCCHRNPGGSNPHQSYCCEGYNSCANATGNCGTGWICSFYGSTVYGCSTNHSPGYCPCGVGCCCTHNTA